MTDKVSESPESTRCKVHKAAQDPGYCQNTLLRIRTRVQSGQIGFISDWVAPPPVEQVIQSGRDNAWHEAEFLPVI